MVTAQCWLNAGTVQNGQQQADAVATIVQQQAGIAIYPGSIQPLQGPVDQRTVQVNAVKDDAAGKASGLNLLQVHTCTAIGVNLI